MVRDGGAGNDERRFRRETVVDVVKTLSSLCERDAAAALSLSLGESSPNPEAAGGPEIRT